MLYFALRAILLSELSKSALAQTQGDIRLVGSPERHFGRVEMFFRNQWSTLCDHNYGGSANVICYQLNLVTSSAQYPGTSTDAMNKALKMDSEFQIKNMTNASTAIFIRDLDCGAILSRPLDKIHILRCDYELVEPGTECTHGDDLAVFCNNSVTQALTREALYDSEVRLLGGNFTSSGTLEINMKDEWGGFCFNDFPRLAADTACRQLGYTHAEILASTSETSANFAWFGGISCGKEAQACLSECFSKNMANTTSCPGDIYVTLQCGFNLTKTESSPSGNPIMCELQKKYSKIPAFFFAIMSVFSGFWLVMTTIIITTAICCSVKRCPCYKLKNHDYS